VYSLALVSLAVLVGRRRRLTGQAGYWRSMLFPLAPILDWALLQHSPSPICSTRMSDDRA